MLMMIDDNRIDLQPGEVIKKTDGAFPYAGLLAADRCPVESNAQTLPEIIEEMLVSTTSERQGRVIDRDQAVIHGAGETSGVFLRSRHEHRTCTTNRQ
ncbi:hypothetical protein MF573_21780 [Klebsiella pneumoniae]|nr:hypothetical protein MF573_21780 [Klebsiella pneumoniae]